MLCQAFETHWSSPLNTKQKLISWLDLHTYQKVNIKLVALKFKVYQHMIQLLITYGGSFIFSSFCCCLFFFPLTRKGSFHDHAIGFVSIQALNILVQGWATENWLNLILYISGQAVYTPLIFPP